MSARQLLVLRHGRTETNERHVITGSMDIPLSPGGAAELSALRGRYPAANRFFTSGMLRARQSLALLYGEVPHTDFPDLGEYRFGIFEGRSHRDLLLEEPIYQAWFVRESDDVICPGGESNRMFAERVARGFRAVIAESWEGLAVLIAHGGVIRQMIRQFAPSAFEQKPPGNATGYLLTLGEGGEVLSAERFDGVAIAP
ncbi:MAG: histidine phosphatase family protein [Oscillospiraceae bacterium]|nr:histidine phosphatase family protein [Oscillospiraceae bacterium]